jgi:serine/threonine protein kinase
MDPLAQDLALAMVEVLRRYAAEGRLPEELKQRVGVAASAAVSAAATGATVEPQLPPTPAPKPEHSKLTNRYQILGPTGGDAFGESFLGRDSSSGNNVMIRLMHKQLGQDPAFMHGFDKSCEAMTTLPHHAHVLEVYAHGLHYGQPFVVTEAVRGRTLGDILAVGEPLPEMDVLRMAEQVASALMHVKAGTDLHHGELRPQAIVVAYSGIAGIASGTEVESVKVGDFVGPRLPWHDPARLPPLAPTFYVAPEQFSPDVEVDARTDMYSLGAIMFHLLTGKPPYAGTAEEVRAGHLGVRVADPGDLVTGLSDATRQVVTTCLATSRNDRFINFQGFIAACQKALTMLAGLRSMRFLRKPMRRVPTPRPGTLGSGTAAIARQAPTKPATSTTAKAGDKPADKPATSTVAKPATARVEKPPQSKFTTPLPQEMPLVDEFDGKDRMQVVSERIMRKHREKKGIADEAPATDTALIRRNTAEALALEQEKKEKKEAKPEATSSPSGRRKIGAEERPLPARPRVLPPPEQPAERWLHRLVLVALLVAVVAYLLGWRPL